MDEDLRVAAFPNTPAGAGVDEDFERYYWLFAIQARDTSGAVSVDRVYNYNVMNLHVNNAYAPELTFSERYLGGGVVVGPGDGGPV